jgi:hypothetical protein
MVESLSKNHAQKKNFRVLIMAAAAAAAVDTAADINSICKQIWINPRQLLSLPDVREN